MDTIYSPRYFIRRRVGGIGGLYGVSIGQNNGLPVLAWVDSPLHAQAFGEPLATDIIGRLNARNGATSTYFLQETNESHGDANG